jgi:hypothetical protein
MASMVQQGAGAGAATGHSSSRPMTPRTPTHPDHPDHVVRSRSRSHSKGKSKGKPVGKPVENPDCVVIFVRNIKGKEAYTIMPMSLGYLDMSQSQFEILMKDKSYTYSHKTAEEKACEMDAKLKSKYGIKDCLDFCGKVVPTPSPTTTSMPHSKPSSWTRHSGGPVRVTSRDASSFRDSPDDIELEMVYQTQLNDREREAFQRMNHGGATRRSSSVSTRPASSTRGSVVSVDPKGSARGYVPDEDLVTRMAIISSSMEEKTREVARAKILYEAGKDLMVLMKKHGLSKSDLISLLTV